MKVVEIAPDHLKVELSHDELLIINAALNEVCNGIELFEFETRIGFAKTDVAILLDGINEILNNMNES
jgi:hypothetical protein